MENFKFRLQKLLDLRVDNEEKSKLMFKKALEKQKNINEKLSKFTNDYDKHKNIMVDNSTIEKKIRQNYLNVLNYNIKEVSLELENQIKVIEKMRKELREKQIERKTVETLKEKQYNEFVKNRNYIEQKNNDEFALYGFMRNLERR